MVLSLISWYCVLWNCTFDFVGEPISLISRIGFLISGENICTYVYQGKAHNIYDYDDFRTSILHGMRSHSQNSCLLLLKSSLIRIHSHKTFCYVGLNGKLLLAVLALISMCLNLHYWMPFSINMP